MPVAGLVGTIVLVSAGCGMSSAPTDAQSPTTTGSTPCLALVDQIGTVADRQVAYTSAGPDELPEASNALLRAEDDFVISVYETFPEAKAAWEAHRAAVVPDSSGINLSGVAAFPFAAHEFEARCAEDLPPAIKQRPDF